MGIDTMKQRRPDRLFNLPVVWVGLTLLTTAAFGQIPSGSGQLETPPGLFSGGTDAGGREYLLNGQPARNGKLILTASNGFFDNGVCRAGGESSLPKVGDDDLIKPNFEMLEQWKRTDGTIRWHLWLPKPGEVRLSFNMNVSADEAGSQVKVTLAGITKTVTTQTAKQQSPQPWNLVFQVTEPGEHTISLSAAKIANPRAGVGDLHTIDVYGSAIQRAQLLRARWRPAAVHGGYACSTVPRSRIWVMTTRSTCDFSSYSPITTPFGYYGTSFEADRRAKGGFNFSMWAARAGAAPPPLRQMPHLLAAGSPEAEFSGFGHEGSGVKLRGWIPMPDRPQVCVQALRVDSDSSYDTYSGYYWDHPSQQWKLYAVGRKWHGGKPREHLAPGSFCEIPGPPHIQRSGDRVREVRRRGWHLGPDGNWQTMDTFNCRSKGPANKFWYTTAEGEFAMGTGGMRYYQFSRPAVPRKSNSLPEFLSAEATRDLHALPAEIASIEVNRRGKAEATISVNMKAAGTKAKAQVFYGESDCLTFAKRKLHGTERNSTVSQSTQAQDRSWSHNTPAVALKDGVNQLTLAELDAETTYYFRILITNEEGRMWSYSTGSFRTQ